MVEEALVIDVTTELIGERRADWRDGYDAGIRRGTSNVLQSNAFEQIALELVLYRATLDVAGQRERLLQHWKSEAQCWREECERISAEYTAFVDAMARRFAK